MINSSIDEVVVTKKCEQTIELAVVVFSLHLLAQCFSFLETRTSSINKWPKEQ